MHNDDMCLHLTIQLNEEGNPGTIEEFMEEKGNPYNDTDHGNQETHYRTMQIVAHEILTGT